jgi:hypothetical protein
MHKAKQLCCLAGIGKPNLLGVTENGCEQLGLRIHVAIDTKYSINWDIIQG